MSEKSQTITIRTFEGPLENSRKITVPNHIYKQINLNEPVTFRVGLDSLAITCDSNDSDQILELPSDLANFFGLENDQITNLRFTEGNNLCLGPVVAVFASNGSVRKANMQNPNFRYIELIAANDEVNTILYHFTFKDVDFIHHRINGTFYNKKLDKWEQKSFPFPNILYDRGGGTLPNQKIISDYIRGQFNHTSDLKKINFQYFFDKWDVHRELVKSELAPYLPKSVLYYADYNLLEMFQQTPNIYIKDCFGNNGKGVARARKLTDGTFELSHFYKGIKTYHLISFEELAQQVEAMFIKKKTILQEAIDVIQINGRNVDMRAAVQKNGQGELVVQAYPVRLGVENCPITSTKSGSTVYRFESFFKKNFHYTPEQIHQLSGDIKSFLFTSFRCIERVYGSFGELGIDFAMDKQGKLWFIECNAKPGKDALYLSYDDKTIRKAFRNPLDYAKFISGY